MSVLSFIPGLLVSIVLYDQLVAVYRPVDDAQLPADRFDSSVDDRHVRRLRRPGDAESVRRRPGRLVLTAKENTNVANRHAERPQGASPAAAPPDGYAIRIRGLQHYFGEGEVRKQVLFDNNLEVAPGEIVIMTGPSGSGKTTLLTLIGTLRTVQEGSVKVLGNELRGATAATADRRSPRAGLHLSTPQPLRLAHRLGKRQDGPGTVPAEGAASRPLRHRHARPARAGTSVSLQAGESFRRAKAAHCHRPGAGTRSATGAGRRTDRRRWTASPAAKSLRSSRSLPERKNARSSWSRTTTASSTSPTESSTWSMAGSYPACWSRSRR